MINENLQRGFWVEDWWVQPTLSEISRHEKTVQLEPKVMALLELLASSPGEVLSRQTLEESVWRGTIVSYDALSKAVTKLREALGDDKKNPKYIQTISKKGYRLIATVRQPTSIAHIAETSQPEIIRQPDASQTKHSHKRYLVFGAVISLVFVIIVYLLFLNRSDIAADLAVSQPQFSLTENKKPVLVVLPFRNIGADESDSYLADGISSDLITDLSRLSGLWVVSASAVSAYKNIDITPGKVKQAFNARYLLSGEITKSRQTIRINVHLTDLEQGKILWANRYDRQFTELFTIQDEVTQKIVQNLSLTLTKEEKQRIARRYTHNLQAYDVFLRAQARLSARTPDDNAMARDMYKNAIELDPGFARAYAGIAITYTVGYIRQWPSDDPDPLSKAFDFSSRALQLDNTLPESYWVAGFVSGNKKQLDEAIEYLNQALTLNPNYADAYALLAWVTISLGNPQAALDYMAKAMRLHPTGSYLYHMQIGRANYYMNNYEQAIIHFSKARQSNPTYIDALLYSAAAFLNLKRYDDVSWMFTELKTNHPGFDIQTWLNNIPIVTESFKSKLVKDLTQAVAHIEQSDKI